MIVICQTGKTTMVYCGFVNTDRDVATGTTIDDVDASASGKDSFVCEGGVEGDDDVLGICRCAASASARLPVVVVVSTSELRQNLTGCTLIRDVDCNNPGEAQTRLCSHGLPHKAASIAARALASFARSPCKLVS